MNWVSKFFDPLIGGLSSTIQAVLLLVLAWIFAAIFRNIVKGILNKTYARHVKTASDETKNESKNTIAIIGGIVNVIINILFFVSAIKVLQIDVLTRVGNAIIGYLPSLLAACLVLIAAWAAANWASDSILKTYPRAEGLAVAAKTGIMVLAGFMAISQLGISKAIINTLFMWLCIAVAAAFAIAFGIGGRDWAKQKLEEMEKDKNSQTGKK